MFFLLLSYMCATRSVILLSLFALTLLSFFDGILDERVAMPPVIEVVVRYKYILLIEVHPDRMEQNAKSPYTPSKDVK